MQRIYTEITVIPTTMVMGEGSINLYIYINLQTLQLFMQF